MKLKVLGSVSPYVKGKNNCPGYMIEKEETKIILDCGSGITREINLPDDLKKLTIIISHLHRDHYADLLTLGYATYVYNKLGLLNEKIKVYFPNDYSADKTYLESMDEHFFEFITYDELDKLNIGNLEITFRQNPHPVKTFAIKVKDKSHTLVYSSDTGYENNTLEEFAKDADLLVCETTFLKTQKGRIDNHLSTIEAGKIAQTAKVKKLMITHTWPEINKKVYLKETKEVFKNVIPAKEGKVLKIGK